MSYIKLGSENEQLLRDLDQLIEKRLDKRLNSHLNKILQAIQNMTTELPEGIQVSEVCRKLNIEYTLFKGIKKKYKLETFKIGGKFFIKTTQLKSIYPGIF